MSTSPSTMSHPPKQRVRAYLERRSKDSQPPPAPEEIRRQLGWGMSMQVRDNRTAPRLTPVL